MPCFGFPLASTVVTLALALCASAAPFMYAGCDVASAKINFPPNQSSLNVPTEPPNSIGLGVGYQNYTCTAEGKYKYLGSIGELYDISCLRQTKGKAFDMIQDLVLGLWSNNDAMSGIDNVLNEPPPATQIDVSLKGLLGLDVFFKDTWLLDIHLGSYLFETHPDIDKYGFAYYFASRPNDGTDYRDGLAIASESSSLRSPSGGQNIDWLSLKTLDGNLAKSVMMVDTAGGQPPNSCRPGSKPLAVKYAAKFWFFGGPPSPLIGKY